MAVITLSRQSGSNGDQIAQILCERLHYAYFDKRMLNALAEEHGWDLSKVRDVSAADFEEKSILERIFSNFQTPFSYGPGTFLGMPYVDSSRLTGSMATRFILAAYEHDNVVIVGRGSQVVLAGKAHALHVRVIASSEKRISTWQERQNLSYKDAEKLVRSRDRAHADFVRSFFGADLDDPNWYDLVISTNKISPQHAVDLIITALENI